MIKSPLKNGSSSIIKVKVTGVILIIEVPDRVTVVNFTP